MTTQDFRTKPDPEHPWRWVCAECHSQVYRSATDTRYRCRTCGSTWARDELVDQVRL